MDLKEYCGPFGKTPTIFFFPITSLGTVKTRFLMLLKKKLNISLSILLTNDRAPLLIQYGTRILIKLHEEVPYAVYPRVHISQNTNFT